MKNGLYKVAVSTAFGTGAGVVTLMDGRIRGGDSAISYIGQYAEDGGHFVANVTIKRHTAGVPSLLGNDQIAVAFQGKADDDRVSLLGSVPAVPGVGFQARLEFISD